MRLRPKARWAIRGSWLLVAAAAAPSPQRPSEEGTNERRERRSAKIICVCLCLSAAYFFSCSSCLSWFLLWLRLTVAAISAFSFSLASFLDDFPERAGLC